MVVAVGLLMVGTERAEAQQATATLERVEAADVDGRRGCTSVEIRDGVCAGSRRVCLNRGLFVLAVEAYDAGVAVAMARSYQSEGGPTGLDNIVSSTMAAQGLPMQVQPRDGSIRNGAGWDALTVEEPQCYEVFVNGGRARLYQVLVDVR